MKSYITRSTVFCIVLISVQTTALAETTVNAPTPRLILVLDVKELARHLNKTATYTSQYQNPTNSDVVLLATKPDAISKKFSEVSKVFKRFTSMRYRKGQKIRAKVGKSSLTLKYTRAL